MADSDTAITSKRLSLIFLLVAPFIYAAYALLTPAFQTPDEHQHVFRAWQLSELQLIPERRGDQAGGVLPDGLATAAQQELGTLDPHALRQLNRRPYLSIFQAGTPVENEASRSFYNFPGSAIYAPAGYVPQITAIWLGKGAGLTLEAVIKLGRLANCALAILLIALAIRTTPFGGLAFLWVGLLPMSAAATASFGQDGMVIGAACLLTATGLKVLVEGQWGRSRTISVALLTAVLTISKYFYFALAMIGASPFLRNNIALKRSVVPLAICVLAAGLTAAWLAAVSSAIVPPKVDVPPATDRLAMMVRDPLEFATLLGRTYGEQGLWMVNMLFTFGWLSIGPVHPAIAISFLALAALLYIGDAGARKIGWRERLWLLAITLSMVLLISIALYLYWTPATANWIYGIQPRYFIPIFPVFLAAILPRREKAVSIAVVVPLLMVIANVVVIAWIAKSFYF